MITVNNIGKCMHFNEGIMMKGLCSATESHCITLFSVTTHHGYRLAKLAIGGEDRWENVDM